ncbi:PLP-dependent transferase [Kamptonema cortianum]|nr:PLP-dependent transferase [Kamptonema cortianum]
MARQWNSPQSGDGGIDKRVSDLFDRGAQDEQARSREQGVGTRAVHGGAQRGKAFNSLTTPIVQTATYTFSDTQDLIDFMDSKTWGDGNDREEYGRYGNPTVAAVERKLAALDGGDDAVLYASGMAAITSTLLTILPAGAHIVITDDCYRRTRQFCLTFLKRFGIETTVVPMGDYAAMGQRLSRWAIMRRWKPRSSPKRRASSSPKARPIPICGSLIWSRLPRWAGSTRC